jgi:hypothetical protein
MFGRVFALSASLMLLAGASSAFAEPTSLGAALFGPRSGRSGSLPETARFQVDPKTSFVLDRSGGEALLKFEDSYEVWALRPTPGPRGDLIYKNDMGEPVLRATRLGGVTLFTSDRPGGTAAAFVGSAPAPRPLTSIGPVALYNILLQSSIRASRAAQHPVEFDAPDVGSAGDWVFADAANLAAEAFNRVASRVRAGRTLVARFIKVQFATGHGPAAVAVGQVVQITVAPDQGVAGRPSSERIAFVISR